MIYSSLHVLNVFSCPTSQKRFNHSSVLNYITIKTRAHLQHTLVFWILSNHLISPLNPSTHCNHLASYINFLLFCLCLYTKLQFATAW